MAQGDRVGTDPAADSRVDYEYTGGDLQRQATVKELRERIDGDVRFDEYSRQLYATDASAYEITPIGVVYPTSTADVSAVLEYCGAREMPVLPRGGGTSLAGQSVNEAVVLDFTRHMDSICAVDPDGGTARAQPGVLLGDLNERLAPHGLKFAPDPAWGDKSALGGAIGNNSTGSHSLQYGKTDAYIESCEVVLADGTVTEFGEIEIDELKRRADGTDCESPIEADIYGTIASLIEQADTIQAAYPSLKRNVSGYNLDRLITEARLDEDSQPGTINVARLLAGSEGTLAVVTEATISLEPIPETKSVALLRYETVDDAMADVAPIVEHDPAAVEVLDDVLLDLARETEEFGELVAEMVPDGTGAVLLVEFYADSTSEGKEKTARLLTDRLPDGDATPAHASDLGESTVTDAPHRATSGIEAHETSERKRFWQLRKSGLPILLSRTTDAKHISFIEDVAVPPEALPDFVADFQAVLDEHDTFASFYGHAGPGCLHVRPLVNTKTVDGLDQMRAIADAVSDLAVTYDGAVSGEHGDGRARTEWNRKLYGQRVWELFRELKTAFDPDWLLNPGQVCGYAPDEDRPEDIPERAAIVEMTDNLRFPPSYETELSFEPQLNWNTDNGMQGMVELCHGCGGCRGPQSTTGGVMCPTYRAADEELTSTRGRANALRQAISGDLPADPAGEEFMTEVMDLCIGCKGCARDCPSEVDMAKLKAELSYQHHQNGETTLRDRLFANVDQISAIGSALAPVSNWVQKLPGSGLLAEKLFRIARERDLPAFRRETLVDWASSRERTVSPTQATQKVVLFPDTYTNYTHPAVGKAAVRVLEAADVAVKLPAETTASGRAAFSKGFLDVARQRAQTNVDALAPLVEDGWAVVVPEPSDAVMFQSDYHDLLSGQAVSTVGENTYGICEFLDKHRLVSQLSFDPPEKQLIYHGHCHQKAIKRDHHAVATLRQAGYTVDVLDSGCCGMAGSFGYEAEHYSMSQAIASIVRDQISESNGDVLVAPGASCRSQLERTDEYRPTTETDTPPHPAEMLSAALRTHSSQS